nr:envelope protein 2 variant 948 [Hepacivirus hominis]
TARTVGGSAGRDTLSLSGLFRLGAQQK